jgi:hypothetical protein
MFRGSLAMDVEKIPWAVPKLLNTDDRNRWNENEHQDEGVLVAPSVLVMVTVTVY